MNSSLVTYTNLTKNHSGQRTHSIDRFTPHCIVGQWTAQKGCDYFATTTRQCSCNYVIGKDGSVGLSVDENNRSWCSSSNANDQRAITIECASDATDPYAFTDACYNKLVELCVDVCKRYNKTKLVYIADKNSAINYEPKQGEMQLTLHRFFAAKACPGNWFVNKIPDFLQKVNAQINVTTQSQAPTQTVKNNDEKLDFIEKVSYFVNKHREKYGIKVTSPIVAQFCLESGYGKSELAINAQNYAGLKYRANRCPTCIGIYYKVGSEQNADGSYSSSAMQWCKFKDLENCVIGYFDFLKNGYGRYDNLKGITDPKKYLETIKADGYATSLKYVDNLMNVINSWGLTKYDNIETKENTNTTITNKVIYTVVKGDTLNKIADKFGTTASKIAQDNNIKNINLINVGQKLDIITTKEIYKEYTVKHGDTLYKIAQSQLGDGNRYKEIVKLNNLTSNVIYSNQVLKIPN